MGAGLSRIVGDGNAESIAEHAFTNIVIFLLTFWILTDS